MAGRVLALLECTGARIWSPRAGRQTYLNNQQRAGDKNGETYECAAGYRLAREAQAGQQRKHQNTVLE